MKIRGTDFVMFEVSDFVAAAHFYRDVVGLPQEIYSEEYKWAEFDGGSVTLALKGGATVVEGGTGARLASPVDHVEAANSELQRKGARVVSGPQDHGVCQAVEVLDPDGNVIILHHRADGTFGRPQGEVKPAACP